MAVVRLFIENIDDVSGVTEELEKLGMKCVEGDQENMSHKDFLLLIYLLQIQSMGIE